MRSEQYSELALSVLTYLKFKERTLHKNDLLLSETVFSS